MKNSNAEIIAVGTELLLGQIANTNAQWISQQLATYGINVHYHSVVGDNLQRVEAVFRQAQTRSDIIIVTGGLGPTEDDLTREAFQLISGLEMNEHPPSMKNIIAHFEKQHSKMTPNNRKQARVFNGADVIENKVGMAPGMIVTYEKKTWFFLPGVPKEMKGMITDDVIPYLNKMFDQIEVIKSMVLRFIGIGESRLEHELRDLINQQTNPTIAPLAQKDGVVIRLTVKEQSVEKADQLLLMVKEQILSRVGNHFVGIDQQTIEDRIISMLKEQNFTIAAAESLTGGMFTEKLIAVPGSSQVCRGGVICYDTNVKTGLLGIPKDLISINGTVSEECALAMAENVSRSLGANVGISFTGVAGPESIEGKPVGTVFIALCNKQGDKQVEKYTFQGDRNTVRYKTVLKGLELLFHFLK